MDLFILVYSVQIDTSSICGSLFALGVLFAGAERCCDGMHLLLLLLESVCSSAAACMPPIVTNLRQDHTYRVCYVM